MIKFYFDDQNEKATIANLISTDTSIKTKLYSYYQNNPGGGYVLTDLVGHRVFVEAPTAAIANERAKHLGIYFDGVQQGIDCNCCHDRWHKVDEDDAIYLNQYTLDSESSAKGSASEWFVDFYCANLSSLQVKTYRCFLMNGNVINYEGTVVHQITADDILKDSIMNNNISDDKNTYDDYNNDGYNDYEDYDDDESDDEEIEEEKAIQESTQKTGSVAFNDLKSALQEIITDQKTTSNLAYTYGKYSSYSSYLDENNGEEDGPD